MENLILSLEIVLPLFVVMAVGWFSRRVGLLDGELVRRMNRIVFHVFLPVLLCKNIYSSSLESLMSPGIFVFAVAGILAMFFILLVAIPRMETENSRRGVMMQAIFRSNYAYFGIPLVEAMFPGRDTSVASLLVAVVVPLFNVLAVIVLETYRGGRADARQIGKKILTNPLIIGSLLGLVLLLTGLHSRIPAVLLTAINDLGKVATPLALFLLGASIDFSKTGGHIRQLAVCVLGKLVVFPVLAVAIAALLGFRDVELASVLIIFGAPAAVNSAVMAQQMGGDAELATDAVVFSTAFSAFTVFLFVFVLKSLALV